MEPSEFQFGLGPNAIRPIQNAKMISPGEEGYPHHSQRFLILGTILNGDTRAYPISKLTRHEIADEKIGLLPHPDTSSKGGDYRVIAKPYLHWVQCQSTSGLVNSDYIGR